MAYRHVYVDPDATGTPENGTTWDKAYASLNAAEQAEDNTGDIRATGGSNEIVVFHVRASAGTADATAASISGWTTDAGGYIVVVADAINTSYGGGASETTGTGRHAGVWSNTKYHHSMTGGDSITISEEYVRVIGLQLSKTSTAADNKTLIYVVTIAAGNDIRVGDCILRQAGNATYIEPSVYVNDADATVYLWNCVLYGNSTRANVTSSPVVNVNGTTYLYNCTAIGGYHGVRVNSGTVIAKNTYAYGSSAGWSNNSTLTTSYCASNTTELGGTGDIDSVALDTTNFTNVTAGSEDFRLPSGSALCGVGTTLTDDPPGSTALGTDIAGASRTVTWDIGAFEFVAAVKALLPRFTPYRLWTRRYN